MTFPDIVVAGLTGGVASAFVSGIYSRFSDNRKRKADHIQQQLQLLYGPLHYFAVQNEKLYAIDEKARKVFLEVSERYTTSSNHEAHEKLAEEIAKMQDVTHRYSLAIIKNNRSIIKILKENWGLIDQQDETTFGEFHVDLLRMDIEYDENQRLRLPGEVLGRLGPYRIIIPEFMDLIKRRFGEKQNDQQKLMTLTFQDD